MGVGCCEDCQKYLHDDETKVFIKDSYKSNHDELRSSKMKILKEQTNNDLKIDHKIDDNINYNDLKENKEEKNDIESGEVTNIIKEFKENKDNNIIRSNINYSNNGNINEHNHNQENNNEAINKCRNANNNNFGMDNEQNEEAKNEDEQYEYAEEDEEENNKNI